MKTNSQGYVMPILLISTAFMAIITVFVVSQILVSLNLANAEGNKLNAQFAADAGLDTALVELSDDSLWLGTDTADPDWSGVGNEVNLHISTGLRTTYEVTVTDISSNRKSIRSVGRAYSPATSTTPKYTRIFEVEVEGITASSVSIVTGVGGLELNNSSKITDGEVFVNGEISMSGTSQIGTALNPVDVFVANQVCPIPADATFPQLCSSGENNDPVDIGSPNSFIYGEVSANHQVDDSNMVNVNNPMNSALIATSGVSPQSLPAHDRAAQEAAVSTTISGNAASCTSNNGSKTWAANTRITGDVRIEKKCEVTIEGDVWIEGSFEMRQSGELITSNSLGTTVPVVMVDDQDGFEMNNSSLLVPNSSGTNVQIITYWADAACDPGCTTLTGTELADSQDERTIDIGNSGGATNAILYARWSTVRINNSVNVGALVGQVVELNNGATIAFGSSLPGFSPTTTWVQKGYLRVFQ